MAPKLTPLHWSDLDTVLRKLGYEHARTKGSHRAYVKPNEPRAIIVQYSRDIPKGTVRATLRQIGIDFEEFQRILHGRTN